MDIEQIYINKMRELGPQGRIARLKELYTTGWNIVATSLRANNPNLEGRELRLAVAKRMYRNDPQTQKLIKQAEKSLGKN